MPQMDVFAPDSPESVIAPKKPARRTKRFAFAGRYSVLLEICTVILLCFTALRIAMLLWFSEPGDLSIAEFGLVFLTGLRFDLFVTLCAAFPQMIFLSLIGNRQKLPRLLQIVLEIQWFSGYTMLISVVVAEWLFFAEFQTRLNYIAFEYLVYPKEVCCNIWESYQTGKLLTVVLLVGVAAYSVLRERYLRRIHDEITPRRRWSLVAATFCIILTMWFLTPMSSIHVTRSRTANECAGNGIYSFVYYAWTCRFDFNDFYQTTSATEAVAQSRNAVESVDSEFIPGSQHPLDRIVTTNRPQRDANVVLILEESLGSDFIGALGDKRGLTPEFDKLSTQGLLFNNWYATGNRTARALEAVTTAMPPLPTESILKRDHSTNVFTVANVLAERGYERLFVTGGRGMFDGVRFFMTANGYNHFVEQGDFEDPGFANAWGVADEDMFHRAIEELDKLHQQGKPFLATLLTVSNHRPYTFPADRIDSNEQTRENAVRYADWAIGDFFRRVREKEYYKNTIFIVMGDHGARVYGSQLFPIRSYRVPVLVIDPQQSGTSQCSTLASSMDVAPTIMGLLGGDYRSVFFGRDALAIDPKDGYALMQHNHEIALLNAKNQLTILSSQKRVFSFDVNPATSELIPRTELYTDDASRLMSVLQTANRLYYSDACHPDANTRVAEVQKRIQ
jgi:phosphoglycerol transferase MdoB-like AlkP superfamily enzyme